MLRAQLLLNPVEDEASLLEYSKWTAEYVGCSAVEPACTGALDDNARRGAGAGLGASLFLTRLTV